MKDIDLFASLRDVSKKGDGKKFAIRVEGPGSRLIFHPDDREVAAQLALAITEQMRANLAAGRGPDGVPLGGIDGDTVERRQALAEQGGRGGEAAERYVDVGVRGRTRRNYDRQYVGKRGALAGRVFTPVAGGPRGVVSGMLAESVFTRPDRGGKGFMIYVAGARSKALPRVLGTTPVWSGEGMQQEKVRLAMREAAHRILGKSLVGILRAAMETLEHVQELADED